MVTVISRPQLLVMQSTVALRTPKTTTKFPAETTKEMCEKLPRAITNSRYYVIADNSRGRQKIVLLSWKVLWSRQVCLQIIASFSTMAALLTVFTIAQKKYRAFKK